MSANIPEYVAKDQGKANVLFEIFELEKRIVFLAAHLYTIQAKQKCKVMELRMKELTDKFLNKK